MINESSVESVYVVHTDKLYLCEVVDVTHSFDCGHHLFGGDLVQKVFHVVSRICK